MKFLLQTCIGITLFVHTVSAQKILPVLKAATDIISIKEGASLYKNAWNLTPSAKPDVFVTNPFQGKQTITFYSSIDSITFVVTANRQYNFIIVHGHDSAYTQINTSTTAKPTFLPPLSYTQVSKNNYQADTIPFYIKGDHGVHFKGTINGSDTIDFLFDTNAGAIVLSSDVAGSKVKVNVDGDQLNNGADGTASVSTSSRNKIRIGNLEWNNAPLLLIKYNNASFDAVLGWVAFEDKIVEIDYDRQLFIIHHSLPRDIGRYSRLAIEMISNIPYVKCRLVVDGKESDGLFGFDTGSDGTLAISQKFASEHSLNNVMKKVGTSTSVGSAGVPYHQQVVMLPRLKIGNYEMNEIQLHINDVDPKDAANNEIIGNQLLMQFNTIIDFKNKYVYIRPNKLFPSSAH